MTPKTPQSPGGVELRLMVMGRLRRGTADSSQRQEIFPRGFAINAHETSVPNVLLRVLSLDERE